MIIKNNKTNFMLINITLIECFQHARQGAHCLITSISFAPSKINTIIIPFYRWVRGGWDSSSDLLLQSLWAFPLHHPASLLSPASSHWSPARGSQGQGSEEPWPGGVWAAERPRSRMQCPLACSAGQNSGAGWLPSPPCQSGQTW